MNFYEVNTVDSDYKGLMEKYKIKEFLLELDSLYKQPVSSIKFRNKLNRSGEKVLIYEIRYVRDIDSNCSKMRMFSLIKS